MLDLRSLCAGYDLPLFGAARDGAPLAGLVLRDLSLSVPARSITAIMGRNGAGKTTLLKVLMGLVPLRSGSIVLNGQPLNDVPAHRRAAAGLGYVPQGRRLFGEMTVAENLEVGLRVRGSGPAVRRRVLELFPRLGERLHQEARSLSGGEQQMLAIGRALCTEPGVLLLDEPTEGLQPSMITLIRDAVQQLQAEGVTVILVEQRVDAALRMADQIAFMVQGKVAAMQPTAGLTATDPVFARYVGV